MATNFCPNCGFNLAADDAQHPVFRKARCPQCYTKRLGSYPYSQPSSQVQPPPLPAMSTQAAETRTNYRQSAPKPTATMSVKRTREEEEGEDAPLKRQFTGTWDQLLTKKWILDRLRRGLYTYGDPAELEGHHVPASDALKRIIDGMRIPATAQTSYTVLHPSTIEDSSADQWQAQPRCKICGYKGIPGKFRPHCRRCSLHHDPSQTDHH